MTRFFEIAREEVHRYGGTVEKFIGDAVMAVFGLPVISRRKGKYSAYANEDPGAAYPTFLIGTLCDLRQ